MSESHVTQCPHCRTSFRVSQAQLAAAHGVVRCGACLHVFNAAEQLFGPATTSAAVKAPSAAAQQFHAGTSSKPAAKKAIDDTLWIHDDLDLDNLDLDEELARLEEQEQQLSQQFLALERAPRPAERFEDSGVDAPKDIHDESWTEALLRDEPLVREILAAVVGAVDVPVTLKIRTGWDRQNKNGITVAKIAEDAGIAALSVHGRTRADLYTGEAEYDTIAAIKQAVSIPVFANGDIDSPEKAKAVLDATGADALLIGRAAQGRPWIFREIEHYLRTGEILPAPSLLEVERILLEHLAALHAFYGELMGVRIARKHVGWYLATLPGAREFRAQFNRLDSTDAQCAHVRAFFRERHNDENEVAA